MLVEGGRDWVRDWDGMLRTGGFVKRARSGIDVADGVAGVLLVCWPCRLQSAFGLQLNVVRGPEATTLRQEMQTPYLKQHTTMSRLTRKASTIQLLSLNAQQAQTEQQALHAEVNSLKEASKRDHTAYIMIRDDVERFKGIVRAQDAALRGLQGEVAAMRREIAALTGPPVHEKPRNLPIGSREREQVKRR